MKRLKFNGRSIKVFRAERGLSRDKLVIALNEAGIKATTRNTIANWENGKTKIDAESLTGIAMFFNKPITAFFIEVK